MQLSYTYMLLGFSIGGLAMMGAFWINHRKCYTPIWWIAILIIAGLAGANNIYQSGTTNACSP